MVCFALTVALSWLMYVLVEAPSIRWGARLTHRRSRSPGALPWPDLHAGGDPAGPVERRHGGGRGRRRDRGAGSAGLPRRHPRRRSAEIAWTARKIWDLRLLRDEKSLSDVGAPVLVVSQFTLYGEARKGRRPTWQAAAPGPVSEPAYDAVCDELERLGARVARGVFGADMQVSSVNDGPITLVLDTP